MKKTKVFLLFSALFMLASCGNEQVSNKCTVDFNLNTTLNATKASSQTVKKGAKIKKPSSTIIGQNPDNYQVYGWYKESSCINEWNFKKDTVSENMTLFAKWEKKFTVKYFVGSDITPVQTLSVFNGAIIKEHKEYCLGYEYLGSYSDPEYTTPFDYNVAITSNVNIYMKRSDGICLYEGNEAGGLFDNLEIHPSTNGTGEVGNITKTEDKSAILVDFGYSPTNPDPFVELSLNLDITKSQILHFEIKNLGPAKTLSFYYTTLLDKVNYTYSATGNDYTQFFSIRHQYKPSEMNCSIEDDYTVIDIDFAKNIDLADPSTGNGLFHGYSVWGTSNFLGKLRIQSSYASKNYEDRSNKIIIKKIWGTSEGYEDGVKTEDTDEIKELCYNSEDLPVQEDIENGFIFPKDREYVHTGETSQVYNNENGMFLHFENEIEMRNKSNKYQNFTIDLPMEGDEVIGPKQINLEVLKSIEFEIQNFSYVTELNVAIKNDYGGTAYTTLKMPTRMAEPKMFSVNLSKETTMAHTLKSIEFEIIASGVDNLILLNSIRFDEAKPADINGIDLDDTYCYGFNGENVNVTYALSSSSTQFDVKEDGAFVTSSKENIRLTNRGYYKLTLAYSRTTTSEIDKVFISFKNGEGYSPEVEFEIDKTQTAISSISSNFDVATTGDFTNIKIRFAGTGIIRIRSIRFDVDNNYSLKLSNDFSNAYDSTWINGLTYSYDENKEASLLSVNQSAASKSNNISFYLSVGHHNFPGAYNCANLNLEDKTKFVVVYRAENNDATGKIILGFSHTENDNPDETGTSREFAVTFKKSSLEYEWKYLEVDIPSDFAGWYLGKISFRDVSSSVSLRLASVI